MSEQLPAEDVRVDLHVNEDYDVQGLNVLTDVTHREIAISKLHEFLLAQKTPSTIQVQVIAGGMSLGALFNGGDVGRDYVADSFKALLANYDAGLAAKIANEKVAAEEAAKAAVIEEAAQQPAPTPDAEGFIPGSPLAAADAQAEAAAKDAGTLDPKESIATSSAELPADATPASSTDAPPQVELADGTVVVDMGDGEHMHVLAHKDGVADEFDVLTAEEAQAKIAEIGLAPNEEVAEAADPVADAGSPTSDK